ncbi:MAG: hypothetical protein NVS9B3_06910 [Gemmatimonadaceae bacterium]
MAAHSRARAAREARRAAQFSKFRRVELNLIPLVDTFVSIVFFALTTTVVGEIAPIVNGVTLPDAHRGAPAQRQITLGVGSNPAQLTLGERRIMTVQQAAQAVSNVSDQPLVIPALYEALKVAADSVRSVKNVPANASVDTQLAIQGDRTMRYDLLSRVLQTARYAGFKNLTLQVHRAGGGEGDTPKAT